MLNLWVLNEDFSHGYARLTDSSLMQEVPRYFGAIEFCSSSRIAEL